MHDGKKLAFLIEINEIWVYEFKTIIDKGRWVSQYIRIKIKEKKS
jgi:hypothetical protein